MTTQRHCFAYIATDLPADMTIDEYRRSRSDADGRRRWWRLFWR